MISRLLDIFDETSTWPLLPERTSAYVPMRFGGRIRHALSRKVANLSAARSPCAVFVDGAPVHVLALPALFRVAAELLVELL